MLKKSTFPNFLCGILLVCYKGYLTRPNPVEKASVAICSVKKHKMPVLNVPVYIGPYWFAYVGPICNNEYACLRILHRFHVLLEISVALVPCILAAMPSNNRNQGQLALPSNRPNSRPVFDINRKVDPS